VAAWNRPSVTEYKPVQMSAAQSAAMDVLLRLIRDLPGSLDYLRGHAA